jgi:hypothetical protein
MRSLCLFILLFSIQSAQAFDCSQISSGNWPRAYGSVGPKIIPGNACEVCGALDASDGNDCAIKYNSVPGKGNTVISYCQSIASEDGKSACIRREYGVSDSPPAVDNIVTPDAVDHSILRCSEEGADQNNCIVDQTE